VLVPTACCTVLTIYTVRGLTVAVALCVPFYIDVLAVAGCCYGETQLCRLPRTYLPQSRSTCACSADACWHQHVQQLGLLVNRLLNRLSLHTVQSRVMAGSPDSAGSLSSGVNHQHMSATSQVTLVPCRGMDLDPQ
jgi:hypothetical protein